MSFTIFLANLAQLWRDVPSYYKVGWETYSVRVQPSSSLRQVAMLLVLRRRDIVPVFDGTELVLDLRGYRKGRQSETRLGYEWIVCDEDEGKRLRSGSGGMLIPREERVCVKTKAISFEPITTLGRYVLKIKLSSSLYGASDYKTASRFTVRDWDDFSMDVLWPVLLGLLLSFIGGLIGWFLRGGG